MEAPRLARLDGEATIPALPQARDVAAHKPEGSFRPLALVLECLCACKKVSTSFARIGSKPEILTLSTSRLLNLRDRTYHQGHKFRRVGEGR